VTRESWLVNDREQGGVATRIDYDPRAKTGVFVPQKAKRTQEKAGGVKPFLQGAHGGVVAEEHTRARLAKARKGSRRDREPELGACLLGLVLVANGGANLSHHFVRNFVEFVGFLGVLGSLHQHFHL
jgi:hypothetical protein